MNEGVLLWRKIAESLTEDIEKGRLGEGQRLPPSEVLATRFGVNRHTVRRAVSYLQQEGLVRIERGRGVFAVVNPLSYGLGPDQLFEQNLQQHNLSPFRTVLSAAECHAPADIGVALQLGPGEEVLLVTTLGEANDVPINYGIHYIACSRLPGITAAFTRLVGMHRQQFSFSGLFAECGMAEMRRQSVRIRSRQPTNDEARFLAIGQVEHVLVTTVRTVGAGGVPLTFADTSFPSSRVELTVTF